MQLVTVKCPKCGHLQEERQDCVRCGIVFAKYYAMYPQGMLAEGQETMISSHAVPSDTISAEISDLRQGVREIANRLNDVEFDRAERGLLRGEVKSVEQRVAELAEDLKERLVALENRASKQDQEQKQEGLSRTALASMAERLNQIEEKLAGLVIHDHPQDPGMADMVRQIAARQSSLEGKAEKIIAGMQSGTSGQPLEKALEELRAAVQTVTVRYSEIGDLKKNHLVLQNDIETLRRGQEALRSQPANGTVTRIVQLESEVAALRAELRQTLKRLESMEVDFGAQLREARASIPGNSESAGISSALAQLNTDIRQNKAAWVQQSESVSSELRRFEEWSQSMSADMQETRDGLKESCRRIDDLASDVCVIKQGLMQLRAQLQALQDRAQEAGPPHAASQPSSIESDLGAIKEGLDQIRVFMQAMAQKR